MTVQEKLEIAEEALKQMEKARSIALIEFWKAKRAYDEAWGAYWEAAYRCYGSCIRTNG